MQRNVLSKVHAFWIQLWSFGVSECGERFCKLGYVRNTQTSKIRTLNFYWFCSHTQKNMRNGFVHVKKTFKCVR